jgi:DNA-3-methyladenine glycosylase
LTLTASAADEPTSERSTTPAWRLQRLDGACLAGPVETVAQALLGSLIVRDTQAGRCIARIVETEAYAGPEDRASHARAGRTARTSVMFGPPGRAYVYLVYGMHHCLNVVCGPDGLAAAVLIRAVEPLAGIGIMRRRRGASAGSDQRLGSGPACACQALAIDRGLDGIDLLSDRHLWLARPLTRHGRAKVAERIVAGPRIGVAYAGTDWSARPWRVGLAGHPSLSRPFPAPG